MATAITGIPYLDPPRVEVLVQGSTATRINVYRLADGASPVLVRGAIRLVVTDPLAVVDHEAPVGVPVVYSVQELDTLGQPTANVASAPVTVQGAGTWLSQPLYPERVVRIDQLDGSLLDHLIEAYGENIRVAGRDLGVWMGSGRGGTKGTLSFAVQAEGDRRTVAAMFGARGEQLPPVLCLRSTLEQRLPQPFYFAVPAFAQRGMDWQAQGVTTIFDWAVEETSMPSPAIVVPEYTYQDLEAAWSGVITTNLLSNPSFGTNATGWAGVGGALARVAAAGASGTGYGRVTSTAGATQLSASTTVPLDGLVGLPVSARLSARSSNVAGQSLQLVASFLNASSSVVSTVTGGRQSLTSSWQSWTLENAVVPAGAVSVRIEAIVVSSAGATYVPTATSQVLDVDAALVAQASAAPTYFDGSSTGAEWLGTANASQSYLIANTYRGLEQAYQTYSDIERDYSLGGLG